VSQRQKGIVEKLYAECMALEELLEEAVNTLGPDARDILGQIRCCPAIFYTFCYPLRARPDPNQLSSPGPA
jgi:hypothetical protein